MDRRRPRPSSPSSSQIRQPNTVEDYSLHHRRHRPLSTIKILRRTSSSTHSTAIGNTFDTGLDIDEVQQVPMLRSEATPLAQLASATEELHHPAIHHQLRCGVERRSQLRRGNFSSPLFSSPPHATGWKRRRGPLTDSGLG